MQEPLTAMQYDPMPDNFSRLRRASISHFKFSNSGLNSQICRYKIYWNINKKINKSLPSVTSLFLLVCLFCLFCYCFFFQLFSFVCLFVNFFTGSSGAHGMDKSRCKGKQRRHISRPFPILNFITHGMCFIARTCILCCISRPYNFRNEKHWFKKGGIRTLP